MRRREQSQRDNLSSLPRVSISEVQRDAVCALLLMGTRERDVSFQSEISLSLSHACVTIGRCQQPYEMKL